MNTVIFTLTTGDLYIILAVTLAGLGFWWQNRETRYQRKMRKLEENRRIDWNGASHPYDKLD